MSHPDEVRPAVAAPDDDGLTAHIVEVWRIVLREPDVHADSDLFDAGATSLAAVRIRSCIRAMLGKEVEMVDIMEHPTPRLLAPVVRDAPEWEGRQPWQQLDWSGETPDGQVAVGPPSSEAGAP